MDKVDYIRFFWRQYKLYEKELINTADYVSICPQNNATFSNKYQQIFVGVCSEIDSVMSELCCEEKNKNFPQRILSHSRKNQNILYKKVVTKFPYDKISLVPFDQFHEKNGQFVSAQWWQDYNEIKHNRYGGNGGGRYNYQNANLENTLKSIAALYILNVELANKCGVENSEIEEVMKSDLFCLD